MRKVFLFIIILCSITLLNACAQTDNNYTITGKVGNYNDPAKIYLQCIEKGEVVTQSQILKNGHFSFTGNVKFPSLGRLVIIPDGSPINNQGNYEEILSVIVANEKFNIHSDDLLSNATITGSQLNTENTELEKQVRAINAKLEAIVQEYYNSTPEKQQDEAYSASVSKQYDNTKKEISEIYVNFIRSHSDSYLSLIVLKQYENMKLDANELESLYNSLGSKIKESAEWKTLGDQILAKKKTMIGSVAPDFTQNDPNGNPVSLSSFRGKYVLIDFWASWCGPCRKENPNVVKAYNKYKNKNFEILGVSLDNPGKKDTWLNAVQSDGLVWTQVSDLKGWKNEVAVLYNIVSIPQNFLLDPNGVIIAKNLRGEELDQTLESILQVNGEIK